MTFESLRFEIAERIATVTFATPQRLNAITERRLEEMEAVMDAVEADSDLGALIITGEGRAFCVGLDLDLLDRAFADMAYFEATVRRLASIIARLEALDIPTIVAANGIARAGGFELILGCDFLIQALEARIGDVHTDAGVLPACVSMRLRRRVGDQRAKEIIWTARWIDGAEAVDMGLAIRAVPLADLAAEARVLAGQFTDKPRAALASQKALFREGADLGVLEGAELEMKMFVAYMGGLPHGREGYRAYREGRVPAWRATQLEASLGSPAPA
jgi:enoyl-CoA hydratase/carnithine racemase